MVAAAEARGFILGGAVAERVGAGFIPVRKPGKLPWDTHSAEYVLEYGVDALEIHQMARACWSTTTCSPRAAPPPPSAT